MNASEVERLIKCLIPTGVLHQKKLQYFFLELLSKGDSLDLFDHPLEFPNWPKSNLTKDQLLKILNDCTKNKKLKEWPVVAYLASLALAFDYFYKDAAYHWASSNICIILKLAKMGDRKNSILQLCTRFRLAHELRGGYEWLWDILPSSPIVLSTICSQLESKLPSKEQNQHLFAHSKIDPIECVYQILRAYDAAINDKDKVNREGGTRTHLEESVLSQPYRLYRDVPQLNKLIFHALEAPLGTDYQEFRDDQPSDIILDQLANPTPGTEGSAALQYISTRMQSEHITRRDFGFQTDANILALPDCQRLCSKLWGGIELNNALDSCLFLSLLTGSPPEIWLNIDSLSETGRLTKVKDVYLWRQQLKIADLKLPEIKEFTVNSSKGFEVPLPNRAVRLLTEKHSLKESDLTSRANELGNDLKIPILSVFRIQSALHTILMRRLEDHYIADFICGIPAKHSSSLYYSSFPISKVRSIYTSAIEKIAEQTKSFPLEYLKQESDNSNCGSQQTVTLELVREFFKSLSTHVLIQEDHIEQFNAYTILMWHYILILTSARPVDHAPGMLDQIDTKANLLWLADKEIRRSSSSGRLIPICNFLSTALEDYLTYVKKFHAKYHMLDPSYEVLNDIFTSQTSLLNLLKAPYIQNSIDDSFDTSLANIYREKKLIPITPRLVRNSMKIAFPLPLNWNRHFGRFYLEGKLSNTIIDALFGHESPSQEALNPHSSVNIFQIKSAGAVYDQMAMDLNLERIGVNVI